MPDLITCPECGSSDELRELAYRYTWQPVRGLTSDGDAEEYETFDYADDVQVIGWDCRCGWSAEGDLAPVNVALAAVYDQALAALQATVHGPRTALEQAKLDGIRAIDERAARLAYTVRAVLGVR